MSTFSSKWTIPLTLKYVIIRLVIIAFSIPLFDMESTRTFLPPINSNNLFLDQ